MYRRVCINLNDFFVPDLSHTHPHTHTHTHQHKNTNTHNTVSMLHVTLCASSATVLFAGVCVFM